MKSGNRAIVIVLAPLVVWTVLQEIKQMQMCSVYFVPLPIADSLYTGAHSCICGENAPLFINDRFPLTQPPVRSGMKINGFFKG